jgi:hypothetical protein
VLAVNHSRGTDKLSGNPRANFGKEPDYGAVAYPQDAKARCLNNR